MTMFILFLDDGNSPERVCAIAGSPDKVQIAAQMIQELLNDYNVCDLFNFQILFSLIGLLVFFFKLSYASIMLRHLLNLAKRRWNGSWLWRR